MGHVFISYVRDNVKQVEKLLEALTQAGIEVWIDRDHIKPGTRWRAAIREAVRDGAFFLACFSQEYNLRSRSYMNEEITLAIEELRQRPTDHAWFIPVKLSECEIPDRLIGGDETLHSIQCVELYKDWNRGIKNLLSVFKPSSPPHSSLSAKDERTLLNALDKSLPEPATTTVPSRRSKSPDSRSFITLFLLEPLPRQLPSQLLVPMYGHKVAGTTQQQEILSFRQTLNAAKRNDLGFGLNVDYKNRKVVMSFDAGKAHARHAAGKAAVQERVGLGELAPQPYWNFDDLFQRAGIKLYERFFPFAEMLKESSREYHQYNSNLIIQALLIKAIDRGDIYVDFALRTGRNHGTRFRLRRDKLLELNDVVQKLV
jgi:hypothetical protein